MWPHAVIIFCSAAHMTTFVAARFCEGGHICSLPRECCTQGCCPPYQSGPRQLPPPSEHVLNLFFISHWFFWCVVVAIILAILCAYSLWKKRRTLCGWGFADHHTQSEGDSAGSCYAPPQYSRCNSFHHPPPPYTEVTSKPDLYPLVFTCNSDNGKNGSSYLMVQYFRNYIVRPAVGGSLSAASTIDSLSSSFICNANEANTLVPPPYSRAASPEIGGFTSHYPLHHHHHQQQQLQPQHQHSQQQLQHQNQVTHPSYMMPRSASQLVCASGSNTNGAATSADGQSAMDVAGGGHLASQQVYQRHSHYTVVSMNGRDPQHPTHTSAMQVTESEPDVNTNAAELRVSGGGFVQSQSDQHFRYMANSNSSISDIFVNQSCSGGGGGGMMVSSGVAATSAVVGDALSVSSAVESVTGGGGTPVIFSNGRIKPHPLHRTSTNPTQFVAAAESHREPVYNSLNSIEGIAMALPTSSSLAMARPTTDGTDPEFRDLHRLRHSLETCCQMLQYQTQQQQQQQQHQQQQREQQQQLMGPIASFVGSPLRMHELCAKKFNDEGLRSYLTSGTCSAVSSLANIGTPSSPPQATSPTGEVKEILDQIRQLQEDVSYEDLLLLGETATRHGTLQHTMSSPAQTHSTHASTTFEANTKLKRFSTMPDSATQTQTLAHKSQSKTSLTSPTSCSGAARYSGSPTSKSMTADGGHTKRPSTLQQTKKKFYSPKPNKAMYMPMTANGPTPPMHASQPRSLLKSPVGANFFGSRGSRVRKAWISRSAPTTPATNLPPSHVGDDSPLLLNEHDEDPEGEQSAEMD